MATSARKQRGVGSLLGSFGVAVMVAISIIIAAPFTYDHNAQAALDDATGFWRITGGPIIGIDLTQIRQDVFSLIRDLTRPIIINNHGVVERSPALGLWNFIARGRIHTVADALLWLDQPLTPTQAKQVPLCRPLDELTDRTIVISPDPSERGMASWYGPGFDGEIAANGETYSTHDLTAAHKTLPLGTLVRVVKTDTNRSVVVRVTDRGPYVAGRIIDLSYAAKEQLDMGGLAKVYVELLDPQTLQVKCQ